jgi:Cu(I)/Ag(I) efflux system membrane protein CusA/SilA
MRYGENALRVIERVKAKLRELRPTFPPGVEIHVAYDRSALIHRAIDTLGRTLFEEGLVVSLIIFIFLLHLRSTLVPVISLPVAVGLAFVPMYFLGINSNIMSLGGLAIAIGAMVDAAIVLVENAHKHLESAPPGADRNRVLIAAAKEVGPPIFFSLLVITVAFLPIFALNGQAGRLFKPLAYTKTFAMAFAALVSITLAPALMSVFVRGRIRHEKDHPVSRAVIGVYRPFAWVALKNPAHHDRDRSRRRALGGADGDAPGPRVHAAAQRGRRALHADHVSQHLDRRGEAQSPGAGPHPARLPRGRARARQGGRSETATDPAPLSMVETMVKLKPRDQWRTIPVRRWYTGRAPSWMQPALRPLWPTAAHPRGTSSPRSSIAPCRCPAGPMPGPCRSRTASTCSRPASARRSASRSSAPASTRSSASAWISSARSRTYRTRAACTPIASTGGFYLDIVPDRAALARYGLTVGDVQDVIEAAIGGEPIAMTVEGRRPLHDQRALPGRTAAGRRAPAPGAGAAAPRVRLRPRRRWPPEWTLHPTGRWTNPARTCRSGRSPTCASPPGRR